MSSLILRYLHHQPNQENNGGFTLLELLISIVILGILAAIALPSMLKQTLRAKQAGALSYIGSVNRAQQVYRLEFPVFANNMTNLGISFALDTDNYTFKFGTTNAAVAEFEALPKNNDLDALTGCTFAAAPLANTTTSIIKQAANGTTPALPPDC